jgi:hypothetical protein
MGTRVVPLIIIGGLSIFNVTPSTLTLMSQAIAVEQKHPTKNDVRSKTTPQRFKEITPTTFLGLFYFGFEVSF